MQDGQIRKRLPLSGGWVAIQRESRHSGESRNPVFDFLHFLFILGPGFRRDGEFDTVSRMGEGFPDEMGLTKTMDLSLLLQNLLYGVTIGSALILIASGLSLTFGVMGVLNFAHGGLCMLGAYFGYTVVQVTGNFWLAMIVAPLLVAGISILMEVFTIRPLYGLNPLLQLLLTVGLSMVIANAVFLSWGGDSLSIRLPLYFKGSVTFFGLDYPRFRLFVLLFSASLALALWIALKRTKWGIVIRAGMHDLETVNAFGINIYRVFTIVFALGASLAAIAGVVIGAMRALNPEMDFELLTSALLVVVIGGMGSFRGAVVGALVLGVTEAFGAQFFTGAAKFTVWSLMVLVLLFRPEGLLKED